MHAGSFLAGRLSIRDYNRSLGKGSYGKDMQSDYYYRFTALQARS